MNWGGTADDKTIDDCPVCGNPHTPACPPKVRR